MKHFNCLVLEDSLSDQLSIEMILNDFPEIKASYISSPQEFKDEIDRHTYSLFIIDIHLQSTITGIDLIQSLRDASLWVIICSAFDSKEYYEQYKSLHFTKFYIQKPLDEFVFKTHLQSFLYSSAAPFG